ncbi:AAEL010338-PA [Aedes aegypti]|uniref:AAEL010338-PA n=2 Tax=Aedes aegypti TaxID=7159 RepID=A0A1S4FQ93_AEDAE|nr:uncharacterized protein LOC5573256 [Aedes aegypti]EAT37702.1 AAEL010338-PA [Aedes aegypti]
MKALLLLVCCLAIASSSEAKTFPGSNLRAPDNFHLTITEGLLEELKKLLDYLAKAALDAVHDLKQNVDKLISDASQKAEDLLQLANESINEYLQEAKQNLTVLGSQVAECVVPATTELEKIAAHSYENTKKCYDDLVTRVRILTDNVEEHVDYEIKKVAEIQHIGVDCMVQNPKLVDQVKCILDHIEESNAIVKDIISDVGKLTSETTREIVSLSNDTRGCLLDVIRMSRNEVDKVIAEVLQCMKESNSVEDVE